MKTNTHIFIFVFPCITSL